ncbi:MAG: PAS domain-containing protein, partial [Dehalococcoidia bacterium]|nr:PAS domain-containing protein [Dehalococcoidia bacterium]
MSGKKDRTPKKETVRNRQLPLATRAGKAVKKAAKMVSASSADMDKDLGKDKKTLVNELSALKSRLNVQTEDLQKALVELETSRDTYRRLYNTTPVAYFTLDGNAAILSANAASLELLGAGKGGLSGSAFAGLVAPGSQDAFRLAMGRMWETGEKQSCEIDMVRLDGTVFSAYVEIAGIPGPGGAAETVRVIAVDITERKKLEETLRDSEEHCNLLLENTSDGIYIVDRDLTV